MKKICFFLVILFLIRISLVGVVFAESNYYWSCNFDELVDGQSPEYGFNNMGSAVSGGTEDNGKYLKHVLGNESAFGFIFSSQNKNGIYETVKLEEKTVYFKYRFKSAGLGAGSCIGGIRAFNTGGANFRNATVQIIEDEGKLWYNLRYNYKNPKILISEYKENEWIEIGFAVDLGDKSAGYLARCYFNGQYIGEAKSDKGGYHAMDSIFVNPTGTTKDAYFGIDDVVCAYDTDVEDEEEFFKPEFTLLFSNPSDGEENVLPINHIRLYFSAEPENFDGAFSLDGNTVASAEKSSENPNCIIINLGYRVSVDSEHVLKINPDLFIPKKAKPYSGKTEIKFRTGDFERVETKITFFSDADGERKEISTIVPGEIEINADLIPIGGDLEATIIVMKAKGSEEVFRLTGTELIPVSLINAETHTENIRINVDKDEFVKILVWEGNSDSLINAAEPVELR